MDTDLKSLNEKIASDKRLGKLLVHISYILFYHQFQLLKIIYWLSFIMNLVFVGSDPLLCLLFEIDAPSKHFSAIQLHNVAAVWRYRSQINMEHLLYTVQVQNDSHKVLLMFLKEVVIKSQ